MNRGTGRSTRQLESLPQDAVYICPNHSTIRYYRGLCGRLGRNDIELVSPQWLTSDKWRGRVFSDIQLDHATMLSDKEWYYYEQTWPRIRD